MDTKTPEDQVTDVATETTPAEVTSKETTPTEAAPAVEPEVTVTFEDLKLRSDLIASIKAAGFTSPRPIQAKAVPLALEGRDLIGRAQTGSGKTAAFVLPAIHNMSQKPKVSTLVLVPTRELAEQVVQEFTRFGAPLGLRVVSIVGGQPGMRQVELVNRGVHIAVATPGRMLDHISSGRLRNFTPNMVVLDEADEMLDMGFIDDIRSILSTLPAERQTMLFSATMPSAIANLAREQLKNPIEVSCLNSGERHANIEQVLHVMLGRQREQALLRVIAHEQPEKAIIFCRTRRDADELNERLNSQQMRSQVLHGDLSQATRNQAIRSIREGRTRYLIATDVASRGLDIPNISHVFNFHIPENEERYTHRIGRTGRGGAHGRAITLITPPELRSSYYLKKGIGKNIQLAPIPQKDAVEQKQRQSLWNQILETEVHENAAEFLKQQSPSDLEALATKMLTILSQQIRVPGPQEVGIPAEELTQIAQGGGGHSRSRQHRSGQRPFSSSSRRPRHGQSGGQGGGSYGRPSRGGPRSGGSYGQSSSSSSHSRPRKPRAASSR
ncbi:MAG: DEAD/DEAH box helicase [Oligoflexales bacterium]